VALVFGGRTLQVDATRTDQVTLAAQFHPAINPPFVKAEVRLGKSASRS
jgi:hypothetical protein